MVIGDGCNFACIPFGSICIFSEKIRFLAALEGAWPIGSQPLFLELLGGPDVYVGCRM